MSVMKRIVLITLLAFLPFIGFGQNHGPLKFLGIPIDGAEAHFASELRAKGFTYNSVKKSFRGQFNGNNVDVFIHTNHNVIDRIYVAFPQTNEESIRVEFNRLLGQFQENEKYMDFVMNEEIPEDDDISYEISIRNKRYEAIFSYYDADRDPLPFVDALLNKLSDFFTEEQRAKLKEFTKELAEAPSEEHEEIQAQMMEEMQALGLGQGDNSEPDPEKALKFLASLMDGMKSLADGEVWFMIHEQYGRYYIGLYYDNLHNRPHGEDL